MSDLIERLQKENDNLLATTIQQRGEIQRLTGQAKLDEDFLNQHRAVIDKLDERIAKLEAVIREVRSNMNKRAVDSFDYAGGEYAINGDTINMLVLDIADRDERINKLEAELKQYKDKAGVWEAVVGALKEANIKFIGTRADKLNAALKVLEAK